MWKGEKRGKLLRGADSADILAVKTEEQEPVSDWKDVGSIFADFKYFEF